MWELYDALIDAIDPEARVEEALLGPHWAAVRSSEGGAGLGMRFDARSRPQTLPEDPGLIAGMRLTELARRAVSWNFIDAAYGVAAINAWHNLPARARARGIDLSLPGTANEAFQKYRETLRGKKTAVVGHFPYLERLLSPVCQLSILERNPAPGDFPDPACEYLLPEQDYVFITGSALVNKTMPRLLQLACGKRVILVGPSVPLSPALFDFGASGLSGFVVLDVERCFQAVRGGAEGLHFASGVMVHYVFGN